jgi:hypothetical protein
LPLTKQNRLLQPQSIVGAFRAASLPPKPIDLKRNARSALRRLTNSIEKLPPAEAIALWHEVRAALEPLVYA